jgi:hypothetical protein
MHCLVGCLKSLAFIGMKAIPIDKILQEICLKEIISTLHFIRTGLNNNTRSQQNCIGQNSVQEVVITQLIEVLTKKNSFIVGTIVCRG